MEWLAGFRLPDYELTQRDGQYELTFSGLWAETTMWEIPALAIINELRARAAMRSMSRFDLDVLYARAKAKLWSKVERLRTLAQRRAAESVGLRHPPPARLPVAALVRRSVAGGPRRQFHRHLERQARHGHRPRGGRHQRPRAADGLRRDRRGRRRGLREAPYAVLRDWATMYGGNLLVVLPDCFGTTAFLRDAPDWVADWKGARPDSKPPLEASRELIAWWKARGRDPHGEADRALRRDGRRVDRGSGAGAARRGQPVVRLGHQPDQRFPSAARRRGRTVSSRRSRSSARSSRPTDGRRSSSRTIPTRRWERRRRSSATSASSGRTAWRSIRSRCEEGRDGLSGIRAATRCRSSRRWRSIRPRNGSRRTGRPTKLASRGRWAISSRTSRLRLARANIPIKGDRKTSLFRIHRDVRFAKNKDPYKTNAGVAMTRTRVEERSRRPLFPPVAGGVLFRRRASTSRSRPALGKLREAAARSPKALQGDDREAREGGARAQRRGRAQAHAARLRGGRRSRRSSRRRGSGISSA